ncbi:MAG: sugar phosphate isomerase/epimerase family protein [Phycisphaerales bacterium]
MSPRIDNRIGVCSWSLQAENGEDLRGLLRRLSFNTVQLALTPVMLQPSSWKGVVESLRGEGVSVESGMFGTLGEDYSTLDTIARTGGVIADERWHENLELARKVAGFAGEKHFKRVSFHAGFIPHDHTDPRFGILSDRLAILADVFADAGCLLLLETGQETAEDLEFFLNHIGHPNLGVNFDPANMILYGKGDPIAALRRLAPRVGQVHLKDANPAAVPGTWGSEVPLGDGGVDWSGFIEVIDAMNYSGTFMIEREAGNERVKDILAARDYILKTAAASRAADVAG